MVLNYFSNIGKTSETLETKLLLFVDREVLDCQIARNVTLSLRFCFETEPVAFLFFFYMLFFKKIKLFKGFQAFSAKKVF